MRLLAHCLVYLGQILYELYVFHVLSVGWRGTESSRTDPVFT